MKDLLIGTTNPAKTKELEVIFNRVGVKTKSLKNFPQVPGIEETGDTFEEAAILKAKYYFKKTGLPVIADDGGLMVDALGGAPGVKSHRWLGQKVSWEELALAILERLEGVPKEERTARLGSCVAFWNGQDEPLTSSRFVEGYIIDNFDGELEAGFPYRSIFIVSKFNKLYRDLTDQEHEAVNHRRYNIDILKPKIVEQLAG